MKIYYFDNILFKMCSTLPVQESLITIQFYIYVDFLLDKIIFSNIFITNHCPFNSLFKK